MDPEYVHLNDTHQHVHPQHDNDIVSRSFIVYKQTNQQGYLDVFSKHSQTTLSADMQAP